MWFFAKEVSLLFFNEKLNLTRKKYSSYGKEFYTIFRALDHWSHYLLQKEFNLYSNHEALKYINGQHKFHTRHAKWVDFFTSSLFIFDTSLGSKVYGSDVSVSLSVGQINWLYHTHGAA